MLCSWGSMIRRLVTLDQLILGLLTLPRRLKLDSNSILRLLTLGSLILGLLTLRRMLTLGLGR